jgi:hypothetical protein
MEHDEVVWPSARIGLDSRIYTVGLGPDISDVCSRDSGENLAIRLAKVPADDHNTDASKKHK